MPALDEAKIKRTVKVAVGFDSTVVQNGQHNTPWQILLTRTRKTIKKEDKLRLYRDASFGVNAPMEPLLEWQDLAMLNWYDLYPRRSAAHFQPATQMPNESRLGRRNLTVEENDMLEYPRHVLSIANFTNDLERATEWLNVNDGDYSGSRLSKDKWQRAHVGWNKKDKCVVVVQDTKMMLTQKGINRFSFGPLMTAWLAAMAPHAKNRLLVIRHAIHMLLEFDASDGDTNQAAKGIMPAAPLIFLDSDGERQEQLRHWYAFHTLRRMFRMCFGCSMFQHQDRSSGRVEWVETTEPAGSLRDYDLTQDRAYQTYKKTLKPLLKQFEKSSER